MHPLMATYAPLPISFVKGKDVWVWDDNGKRYLDAYAGIAVSAVGHSHPRIIEAVCDQIQKIVHTANLVTIPEQLALAERLTAISGMDNAFFCNSGAEANECAIKLARLYGNQRDIAVPTIIVAENAFHGRTLATLSASGSRRVQAGFEPLVQGFSRAPYNDLVALESIAHNDPNIVAVMLEPIQGESGIRTPNDNYLAGVREICDKHDWLMICDEIQTGVGRTGKWYAFQHAPILPDILTTAKGLGGGIPIGACLARAKAAQLFQAGNHGTTFGGNPLSSRVGSTVLDIITDEKLIDNAERVGRYLKHRLEEKIAHLTGVREVRGRGLMIGIELAKPARGILTLAAEKGLIFNIAGGQTIRLVPPLTLQEQEVDFMVTVLETVIPAFFAQEM